MTTVVSHNCRGGTVAGVTVAPHNSPAMQERSVTDQKTPLRARLAARPAAATRSARPDWLRLPASFSSGDVAVLSPEVDGEPLAEYAAGTACGRARSGRPVPEYLYQLWRRRHFILAFATARNIAMYTEAKLGQLWQVLTPLLNAGRLLPDLRPAAAHQPRHAELPRASW